MYDFWIGLSSRYSGSEPVDPGQYTGLQGASVLIPIQGSRHILGFTSKDLVEDQVIVLLEDKLSDFSTPVIADLLGIFDRWFNLAKSYAQTGLGQKIVLHLEPTSGEIWESQIVDGWVEAKKEKGTYPANPTEDRLRGSLALTLHITRFNYWQQPETQLITCGGSGADGLSGSVVTNQVTIDVHGGTVLSHVVKINLDATTGPDIPAPCRLELENITTNTKGIIFIAQNVSSNATSQSFILEDTAATGGTPVSDSTASGNSYKNCTWSGSAESALLTWSLANTFCQDSAGNFFRFLVRLESNLTYTDIQFKVQLKIRYSSVVVGETSWSPAIAGLHLQEIATMRLPPFQVRDYSKAAALDLVLLARSDSTGSHTLGVDYLQLMPVDGWRRYDPLYPLPQGWKLEEDSIQGIVSTIDTNANEQLTHVPSGNPFFLVPAKTNSFYFAWMNGTGLSIKDDQLKVKAWYCNRRRIV